MIEVRKKRKKKTPNIHTKDKKKKRGGEDKKGVAIEIQPRKVYC